MIGAPWPSSPSSWPSRVRQQVSDECNYRMAAIEIVEILLSSAAALSAKALIESSVHLPKRGTRWIATYRDGSGRQFWKSTGQTDQRAALIVAQKLEREARRAQAEQGYPMPPGSGRSSVGQFTQKEIALVMGLSVRAVREIEKRALRKLRQHPAVRARLREWIDEGVTSTVDVELTDAEIAAVYGLAQTPDELRAVDKLMALVSA
jgi:hypothetical protein